MAVRLQLGEGVMWELGGRGEYKLLGILWHFASLSWFEDLGVRVTSRGWGCDGDEPLDLKGGEERRGSKGNNTSRIQPPPSAQHVRY